MNALVRIPLFPLRTVLFPQGLLPLRIFERRYLDMIRTVMRDDSGFGVLLIRTGAEVGDVAELADVGTFARVADFDQLPDGLLKIVARGEKRFRVLRREMQPDGLHVGEVRWLAEANRPVGIEEFPELSATLVRALADLGDDYPAGKLQLDDAQWLAGHLGQLLPAPAGVRQKILEADSALQRLQMIEALREQQ
jgi:Lon protease-like protein